jgi:hypothetical protein
MNIDFAALGAKAAAEGADQTKAKAAGGDYQPLAAGPCRLRLVGYVEVGKHTKTYAGKPPQTNDKVWLYFEVSGPKHPPREFDGVKYPNIIKIEENLSLSEKANFYKLFTRMNYAGKAQHMVQLLGDPYIGTIYHRTWKGADGKERIEAELKHKDTGYSIMPPRFEDIDTGEWKPMPVAEPLSPKRCFLWAYADKVQWDTLFIDGEYPERKNDKGEVVAKAKSKNVIQAHIMQAVNFQGSPIHELLVSSGASLDIPDVGEQDHEPTETAAPATPAAKQADPMAGI